MDVDSLNRSLDKSLRQLKIRHFERFRCKEPMAEEIIRQFEKLVYPLDEHESMGRLLNFSNELKSWLNSKKNILDKFFGESLLSPLPNITNKKQPNFYNAIAATLIRFELIINSINIIKDLDIGCILGGSLSYGKFFNVRQETVVKNYKDNSDIDLLLIGNITDLISTLKKSKSILLEKYNKTNSFVNIANKIEEINRLFSSQINWEKTVISEKYEIEGEFQTGLIFLNEKILKFPLSLHFTSRECFYNITHPTSYKQYIKNGSVIETLIDIKESEYDVKDFSIYSVMEGIIVPESISKGDTKNITNSDSHDKIYNFCSLPAYFYWENRYVTGIYQNLIIPSFEIIIDNKSHDLNVGCTDFEKFLISEAYREFSIFSDSYLSLSKLHPRQPTFMSKLIKTMDNKIERSITTDRKEIQNSYKNDDRIKFRREFHKKYNKDFSLYDTVLNELMINNNSSILDLGCGNGYFIKLLADIGQTGKKFGIDLIPGFTENYSQNNSKHIIGDIREFDKLLTQEGLTPPFFDNILAIHSLYHLDNPQIIFENVTRWLNDDGIFIASTNSNNNLFFTRELIGKALLESNNKSLLNNPYFTFSSENVMEIFREYFHSIQCTTIESDLIDISPDDLVNYIVSNYDNYEIPENKRERITQWIKNYISSNFLNIPLIDRKITTIIIGRNPIKN